MGLSSRLCWLEYTFWIGWSWVIFCTSPQLCEVWATRTQHSNIPAQVSFTSYLHNIHTGSTPREPRSAGGHCRPHRNPRTWYQDTGKDININHTVYSLTKNYQNSPITKSRNTWDQPRPNLPPHPEPGGAPYLGGTRPTKFGKLS